MLPFKLIYHEGYDLNLGAHVFPSQKFKLIALRLRQQGIATDQDFVHPEPATDEDILRVHSREWVTKLRTGSLTHNEIVELEIPYSMEMVYAFWLAAGGSTAAGRAALKDGIACNLGGGFHHAYPDHGEGFCAIHDVAVAIRCLQHEGAIRRAMIVDVDVHQGNGTAAIFAKDPSVFTLSIHQADNYPEDKPPSSLDLHLADGVEDREYLQLLLPAVRESIERFEPDIMFYLGGADPFHEDQLGGLALTLAGLQARDTGVFGIARSMKIPVATTLAGGYARRLEDTIQIHANTVLAALTTVLGFPGSQ